jgi:tyrosyl-tRNA synthetase
MASHELLTRAVSNVTPLKLAQEKLAPGKTLRVYLGIDPTGAKLHLGHTVPLRKLRAFQDAGHEVILVIGSFTAMIGDPSGRDAQREPLTAAQVQKNFETYIDQAKLVLDMTKLSVRYNHEWLEKLDFKKIVELASHFTVQQMLERDMFEERLHKGNPIGVHEFLYPLMVGYDSVMLDVDCELGGNDQYFNLLAGRTLQKAYGKREKFVLTTKLIEGTDGRKMSKTYDNCVYITDPPGEMFGRIMTINDALIPVYMECCTAMPMSDVERAAKALKEGSQNPRDMKRALAKEIVTLYHGADAAQKAHDEFIRVFSEKALPTDIRTVTAKKGTLILELMVQEKLASSKSDARRLIEQGGVKIDDASVSSIDATVASGILKVGKRKFVRIALS